MSDPLSLVAAGAGFVGLAGQLAQGVIKLKEICSAIKDAPKDVAKLCESVELLQSLLEEVGQQVQQLSHGNVDDRLMREVLAHCETSRFKIGVSVKSICNSIRKSRLGAVRYVFKKKEIEDMLSDVERCKSNIIIARQSVESAMSAFRHGESLRQLSGISSDHHQLLQYMPRVEAIVSKLCEYLRDLTDALQSQHNGISSRDKVARIETIQRKINTSNQYLGDQVSCRSRESNLNSTTTNTKRLKVGFQSPLFSFSVEYSSEQESQHTESKTVVKAANKNICTIRLPKWFVQDQYNLAIARSKNGWLFHPSVHRIVMSKSPFFQACMYGDLETMKTLLTTKQAYLGDRHFSGHSALHFAYEWDQLEACKLLVNAGILNFFQLPDYRVALGSVAFNLTAYTADRTKGREFLQLIEPERNLGAGWLDDLQGGFVQKIVGDLYPYAEETGGSDLDRFEALMLPSIYGYKHDPVFNLQMMSDFLGDAGHVHAIRDAAVESAWLLWVTVVDICHLFAYCVNEANPREETIRAGCFALTVVCDSGLDLHTPCNSLPGVWKGWSLSQGLKIPDFYNCTPFAFIFVRLIFRGWTIVCPPWVLNQVIKLWATTLHSAGVDLAAYAAQEIRIINRILMWASIQYQITYRFLYGPEPSDWKLELGPPGEAYPANFWRGVEAVPVEEDLAVRVLAVVLRVEHPFAEHCEAPGGWQMHRYALEEPSWNAVGWLACMDDDDLAKVEADLERLGAEEFYEVWDLGSVVDEWPCIENWLSEDPL